MKTQIELLAPGGDVDSIKAAIAAGADAIYCGLAQFNARNRASNISFEELKGIIRLAHKFDCKVFLTLNILILNHEIPALVKLLNQLQNINIDGVIVQDLGLLYILSKWFKSLPIHASTQMTTHNAGQIKFLSAFNTERVNLCRELNLEEITQLTKVAGQQQIQTEVFVHGSQCICFSGICYMSSVAGGNSGNRGKCSQPCRDQHNTTPAGFDYPLNLKDNCAFDNLQDLIKAGVYSLKIEGRIKKYDYTYPVVDTYKKQIRYLLDKNQKPPNKNLLQKVFNRDYSNGYLTNEISGNMFINSPRDFSVKRIKEQSKKLSEKEISEAEIKLLEEKEQLKKEVEKKISTLSIEQFPINISFSGEAGSPLTLKAETSETVIELHSKVSLSNKGTEALGYDMIYKRFKSINETDYSINQINLDELHDHLFLPYKELTLLRNQLIQLLTGSLIKTGPVKLPAIEDDTSENKKPGLSFMISSFEDIDLFNNIDATLYFKLTSNLKTRFTDFENLFRENKNLIPWFPSVIIGDDYNTALDFIKKINPSVIVTDNSGIAYEASIRKIKWIAGPFFNITNSYSLISLKEKLNCSGAFISNEIHKQVIKNIKKPKDFKLYYSLYHPITLMTTRQCLFQQVGDCEKDAPNQQCISHCAKTETITNTKGVSFVVEKSKDNYHRLLSSVNSLNMEVTEDFPNKFDEFFVDLSDCVTKTQLTTSKQEVVRLFNQLINGDSLAKEKIKLAITPTTNKQYERKKSI